MTHLRPAAARATVRAMLAKLTSLFDIRDLLVFGGLGMVCYGASLIYPPSGWIIGGAALFWLGARR